MESFVDIPQPSRFRIGELFRDNFFVVPLYQRNYAWETNEIVDFWDDLKDLVDGNRNSHFFGQIVTYKNTDGAQEIIDGQQRLTTSTILMAVIRDIAHQMFNDYKKDNQSDALLDLRDIERQVEKAIRGNGGEHASLTVQHTSENDEQDLQAFFFDLTHDSAKAMEIKTNSEPKKNMQKAYKDMHQWITSYLKESKVLDERISNLQLVFDSFFSKFYVVMISAPSLQDAFTIFETLNSRGKDLKASDVIKNHLLSLMGDNIEEGNKMWGALTNKLDNNSDKITRFIRTYWASKHKIIPESKLYREISSDIKNVNDAKQFLSDLDKIVDLYTVFDSPTTPKAHYEFFENKLITENIDILSRIHVLLYYPVVISMYYKGYRESDILKVVHKITCIFIRHRTIINDGTNKLETGFSDVAKKIWSIELKNVDEIIKELNDSLLPLNETTENSFKTLTKTGGQKGSKKWILIYLISKLYETEYNDFEDKLYQKVFDNDNYKLVQLDTDSISDSRQNYIGNWTIIEKNLFKNEFKDLNDLAITLNKSQLSGNKALAQTINDHGWSDADVNERQNLFTDDVTNIW